MSIYMLSVAILGGASMLIALALLALDRRVSAAIESGRLARLEAADEFLAASESNGS